MRRHALLALAAGCLIATTATADDKDVAKFDGTWAIRSVEIGGMKFPDEALKNFPGPLTIQGGKWTLKAGDKQQTGTFTTDGGKKPAQMDVKPADGPNAGKTLAAIYQLDGETLKICYAPADQERPTAFDTKDKPGYALIVYKRQKPAK